MKKIMYAVCLLSLIACNTNKENKAENKTTNLAPTADGKPFVTAIINGKAWQSIPEEILATYNDFDDKLNIYTKDSNGKMNFLLTLASFSKTGVSSYNSVREGAGGYGISLLDDDKNDNVENDYDNYHQAAVPNCITVTSIKETAEGKIVEGTFASPMNATNNYDANKDKGVVVTDGKFAVLIKK
jgi:hypothetical protein